MRVSVMTFFSILRDVDLLLTNADYSSEKPILHSNDLWPLGFYFGPDKMYQTDTRFEPVTPLTQSELFTLIYPSVLLDWFSKKLCDMIH